MTLGLSQITNDSNATIMFLRNYGRYFDKWFITVADKDKKVYNHLSSWASSEGTDKLDLTYFKWKDDFAAARNYNLKQVDTGHWFWADTDDTIENPERLKELVKLMEQEGIEVIQLKYDYAQNAQGDAISDHWRERLLKTSYEGKWSTPVHEIIQGPPARIEKSDWVTVKHDKDQGSVARSMRRNKLILQKHWQTTKDPRDAYYLGMTALGESLPKEAVKWFLEHIRTSGWDEDQYRSWTKIAECEYILDNFDQALYASDEAAKLKPEFPDAYYVKVLIYGAQEKFDKATEWLKVAMSKPEPETLSIVDPTLYKYRGMAMGAQCYLFWGKVKQAFQLYKAVMEKNPEAFDESMQLAFEDAYFDQKAIDYTKWLLHYTKGTKGKPEKIFQALPSRIFSDVRLNAERASILPKVKWPNKSIVFYCGQASEPWGPDTLDKGMGGSEEAVVYLSRELAKLGWQVTVYNERDEEYLELSYNGKDWEKRLFETTAGIPQVAYKPWTLFNPWDEFDVFVGWRLPGLTRDIKARKKVIDLHDAPVGHAQISNSAMENTDLFFLKSKYQASFAKNVPKTKKVIIGNGLVKEQF